VVGTNGPLAGGDVRARNLEPIAHYGKSMIIEGEQRAERAHRFPHLGRDKRSPSSHRTIASSRTITS